MAVEVVLDLAEALLGDAQLRPVLEQELAPDAVADAGSSRCRRAIAQNQTMPISGMIEIVPSPAITPPRMTVNSPGAMKPTNAPVSRNAIAPTSA